MSSLDPNPLEGKPALRKRLYRAYWCVMLVHGAVAVFIAATPGLVLPDWWLGLTAVLAYVGGALNFQADQNVPPADPGDDERPFAPVHQTH